MKPINEALPNRREGRLTKIRKEKSPAVVKEPDIEESIQILAEILINIILNEQNNTNEDVEPT